MKLPGPLAPISDRIYSDFLMPSRLDAYRGLLEGALAAGYTFVSIESYWELLQDRAVDPAQRYLILRHDIDTDPGTAREMWRIERSLGISSSYYFRLSTIDLALMAEIEAGGSRVSYHFEELATVAKRRRPADAHEAMTLIPEAQDLFRRNLTRLRSRTGMRMEAVTSHGDFVNRALVLGNYEILKDPAIREEMAISLETQDRPFLSSVTAHQSDAPYPTFWIRGDPYAAIALCEPIVYLLVHPRHWRVNRAVNVRDNVVRIQEGLSYRMPHRLRRRYA
jgi:hypothetical protein